MLCIAWCVMTLTHELGHVVCGWATGGKLTAVDLRPWRLPYSLFQPDPMPLVTLWGGPILGVLFPALIASLIRNNDAWFVASFCCLANGAYVATAWFSGDKYLDTPKLIEHGAWPLSIATYCLITIAVGYTCFRRQCQRALGDG